VDEGMSINVTGIAEAIGAASNPGQKQKTGFQNLGTADDPLHGPVLVQDRTSQEYFWSQGEIGIFRASGMISELTMTDTSGGVTTAMHRMNRQMGRGMDVFGGVNRNNFTVSVPSSEYLTEPGSVTYRVRYQDGSSEDVTFHMAPPDRDKYSQSIQRLPGADVVVQEQVALVLESILPEGSPGGKRTSSVRADNGGAGVSTGEESRGKAAVDEAVPAPVQVAQDKVAALRQLETLALRSQEQWFRVYHLLDTVTGVDTNG
jgi:hypothetical protein